MADPIGAAHLRVCSAAAEDEGHAVIPAEERDGASVMPVGYR